MEPISETDRTILQMLAAGRNIWEIAKQLTWTEKHVRVNIVTLCQRFGVDNRGQLVAAAMRQGLIDVPEFDELPH